MRKTAPVKIVVEFAQGQGDGPLLDALAPLLKKAAESCPRPAQKEKS